MLLEECLEKSKEMGFQSAASLEISTLKPLPEVRQMCASNSCGKYGQVWSCPPGCGELQECQERIGTYKAGMIVQTVADVEDSFDFEAMMEAEARHKENFERMRDWLRPYYPRLLPLGAGCCTCCRECTYPEAPCRFPEKYIASMEAYGLLVSQVCQENGIPYYYGPQKISYTACFLLE